MQTRISNALLVGSVIGIIILGYTSDKFSRKGGMLITSGLVIGSLLATLVFQVKGSHNMFWFLTIARVIAGVGVVANIPLRQRLRWKGQTSTLILVEDQSKSGPQL